MFVEHKKNHFQSVDSNYILYLYTATCFGRLRP